MWLPSCLIHKVCNCMNSALWWTYCTFTIIYYYVFNKAVLRTKFNSLYLPFHYNYVDQNFLRHRYAMATSIIIIHYIVCVCVCVCVCEVIMNNSILWTVQCHIVVSICFWSGQQLCHLNYSYTMGTTQWM